jgi:hypothetical protein
MSDDRTKADKAWEARQEDDENYFAVLDERTLPAPS